MLAPVSSVSAADGRYAPSPSGRLHLGNLRTALLAWCFARSRSARFVLRIEDLDPQRSRREHEAAMLADLQRLGIDWDGPPSRQSERLEHHRAAFEQLRSDRRLYRCWCTRAEVREAAAAPHPPLRGATALAGSSPSGGHPIRGTGGQPGGEGAYPGTCRALSSRELSQRERGGAAAAWRLDAGGERVEFEDSLAGVVVSAVDDFVVWRGDPPARRGGGRSRVAGGPSPRTGGVPAYNLAVVVDDAEQAIDEVVRGDDLLETTSRQILLAALLGLPIPRYAHVPLVLGPDGQRLAKRHGAVTLDDRLAIGESVESVVGWMASSVGLARAGSALSAAAVRAGFEPARLIREPTVWQP
jgi:glutamyl-tRNA synthetase